MKQKLSSASSLGSMEESYFLQASLDTSDSFSERRNPGEVTMSPYYMKSMTPGAFEAALRQKEGELASYMSRLVCVIPLKMFLKKFCSPLIFILYAILYLMGMASTECQRHKRHWDNSMGFMGIYLVILFRIQLINYLLFSVIQTSMESIRDSLAEELVKMTAQVSFYKLF